MTVYDWNLLDYHGCSFVDEATQWISLLLLILLLLLSQRSGNESCLSATEGLLIASLVLISLV